MLHRFLFIFISIGLCYQQANAQTILVPKASNHMPISNDAHLFYNGQLVRISVEKKLYEAENPNYFYIKVEVKNLSAKKLGIDLQDHWNVIYPNQWGFYPSPERMIIDETMIKPKLIDKEKKAGLIKAFKDNKLQYIAPNSSFVYYTAFNANGRKEVINKDKDFFILSLDGQLILTNGEQVKHIVCDGSLTGINRELVLPHPIQWEKVRNLNLIIER